MRTCISLSMSNELTTLEVYMTCILNDSTVICITLIKLIFIVSPVVSKLEGLSIREQGKVAARDEEGLTRDAHLESAQKVCCLVYANAHMLKHLHWPHAHHLQSHNDSICIHRYLFQSHHDF